MAGLIITGSHDMVTEHLPWSETIADWLPDVIIHKVPILGICYGHQLLAYALGGKIGNNPHGGEFGTIQVSLTKEGQSDLLFKNVDKVFDAQVSHRQSVLELPEHAKILAYSETYHIQAISYGTSTWGVQFHPEFSPEITREYIIQSQEMLTTRNLNPERILHSIRKTPISASILQHFYRYCQDNGTDQNL
jgi:GMP synthase (glutamine-hydrolysing)